MAAVGRGECKVQLIIRALMQLNDPDVGGDNNFESTPLTLLKAEESTDSTRSGQVMNQLARCCKPVPGDKIVGYLTRGRGMTVHRYDCANLPNLRAQDPERLGTDWSYLVFKKHPSISRLCLSQSDGGTR